MKEIYNFAQSDLNNSDAMVLDAHSTVYIWVGRNANKTERNNVDNKVDAYIGAVSDGRDPDQVNVV